MKNIKSKITVGIVFVIIVILILIVYGIVRGFVEASEPSRQSASRPAPSGNQAQSAAQTSPSGEQGAGNGRQPGGQGAGNGGQGGGRQGTGNGGQNAGTAVRVVEVALGTVENSVILNGDVLASSQVSIYPTMAGKLSELRVRSGDRVNRGQVIAMVDPSRPGDSYFANPVTSTVSGVVVSVPVNTGDTLQTNSVICVVGNLSELGVEIHIPERFSASVRRGLPAQVSFEAMPGEQFRAEVDELSPVLDPASRTMRTRLRIVPDEEGRVDPRILAGMFATANLVTNSRVDVPVIPRLALINTYDRWVVFVVPQNETIARQKEVTLGLESETLVEILSGLETGERVVTAGQNFLTEGDPVRIVE